MIREQHREDRGYLSVGLDSEMRMAGHVENIEVAQPVVVAMVTLIEKAPQYQSAGLHPLWIWR